MKLVKAITVALLACFLFTGCAAAGGESDYFGFNAKEFIVAEEADTHGGFHGDGSYYLILDCSGNAERAGEIIADWQALPLTENLQIVMYGGIKDRVSYSYGFAEEAHWPAITNGVYKFVDRHSEAVDKSDDTKLLDRFSFNFSIAVYDLDTDTLYYFEIDT
ncbi:MAG: hypothetical protein IKC02_03670 [Oscillospiraceae bacterium]|nr:hypothetical protein [Oscillospiraceae bacterium]